MTNYFMALAKLRTEFDMIWDSNNRDGSKGNKELNASNYAAGLEHILFTAFNSVGFNRYGFIDKEGKISIPDFPSVEVINVDLDSKQDFLKYREDLNKKYKSVEDIEQFTILDDNCEWPLRVRSVVTKDKDNVSVVHRTTV